MELTQFSHELKERVNAEIETLTATQPDVLARTSQIIVTLEKYMHELKGFVIKYKFKGIDEEIKFFKSIKHEFAGLLWYYKKLFPIQLFESYNSSEVRLKYYQRQLKRIETYFEKNLEYYQYILSNADQMDEKYFTRANLSSTSAVWDDRFCTLYEIKLSKITCHLRIKDYLKTAIQKIQNPSSASSNSSLSWTGSKTDLIELIYALQAAGVFNKKEVEVKQIATLFENMFNVTLGNYYRVFQDIRLRKTGQTNFMNQLRDSLLNRIKEAEV